MSTQQVKISLEEAQTQYENMKWPELRKKIDAQTAEIAADVATQQAASMKEHLA